MLATGLPESETAGWIHGMTTHNREAARTGQSLQQSDWKVNHEKRTFIRLKIGREGILFSTP